MAKPGDVLEHPITRERITFLETSDQTGGEYTRIRLEVEAGGHVGYPHTHPRLDEHVEILSGEWQFTLNGVELRLGEGATLLVPAGAMHAWRLTGDDAAAIIEFCPSLKTEEYFETVCGLAQDGLADPLTGLPPQPWLALLVTEYGETFAHPAHLPLAVLRATMAPIAEEARRQCLRLPYPYPYPRLRA